MKKLLWIFISINLVTHSIAHGHPAKRIPKVCGLIILRRTLCADKISTPTIIQDSKISSTNKDALIVYNLLKRDLQLLRDKITTIQASIITKDELSTALPEDEEL